MLKPKPIILTGIGFLLTVGVAHLIMSKLCHRRKVAESMCFPAKLPQNNNFPEQELPASERTPLPQAEQSLPEISVNGLMSQDVWNSLSTGAREVFVETVLGKALKGSRAGFPKLDKLSATQAELLGCSLGQLKFVMPYVKAMGSASTAEARGHAVAEVIRDIILDLNPDKQWQELPVWHHEAISPSIEANIPVALRSHIVHRVEIFLVAYFTWVSTRNHQREAIYPVIEHYAPSGSACLRSLSDGVFDRIRKRALCEIAHEFVHRAENVESVSEKPSVV